MGYKHKNYNKRYMEFLLELDVSSFDSAFDFVFNQFYQSASHNNPKLNKAKFKQECREDWSIINVFEMYSEFNGYDDDEDMYEQFEE